MGRPSKGARLSLRTGRVDARTKRPIAPIYFIRDGTVSISTGCGPDRIEEAEALLSDYLHAKKDKTIRARGGADDPADVWLADVVALYARERAPMAADPKAVASRLSIIMEWWGKKSAGDIRRSTCLAYVAHRESQTVRSFKDARLAPFVTAATARRELEDLSAAVSWWAKEHPMTRKPDFTYPPTMDGSARDALSRSQVATLLWAAMGWRRDKQGRWTRLSKSAVANRRHLRRFILLGIYTGSRPGVLPKLRWSQADDSAWVDLEKGWIYRRGRRERDHANKRRPAIRIPKRLVAHLERWKRLDEGRSIERVASGLLPLTTVLHHGGEPIRGKIRKSYANAVADAGLNAAVTPHWQRHTAATWLMEKDVPIRRAAQYLGMTPRTLERHYAHHRPGYQTDVGQAISQGGRDDH